ncbi:hypothetical protein AYI69_g4375 [Smittium culicis]|uniref:Uncharacterized protein n=1 Tax=Smittium culicis TaxID=133412 RepID=A0A1R1YEW5_9FUNG|nr:hypothetical protein AYI69_g4375 [Smittium culicis]
MKNSTSSKSAQAQTVEAATQASASNNHSTHERITYSVQEEETNTETPPAAIQEEDGNCRPCRTDRGIRLATDK